MRVAILGGGLTGLSAAYYLSKNDYDVTVFEKESVLGGLSSGFKPPGFSWSLEKTYHHLFENESDVFFFAKEIGFKSFINTFPQTASFFTWGPDNYRTIPVDRPQDFIRLPMFNLVDKLRAGLVVVALKLSPFSHLYERLTAEEFLIKTMGESIWNGLWRELFRKKFGKYAENILASFIWARINKRTKNLVYIKGGFQAFIDYIEKIVTGSGVKIHRNVEVTKIETISNRYVINGQEFDKVISTLPTPVLTSLTGKIFPTDYIRRLNRIKYLHAVSFIIETKKPVLDKVYWLNNSVESIPFAGLVQHTNMIDKKNYAGKHILYVANYVDDNSLLLKMGGREILDYYLPHISVISGKPVEVNNYHLFKARWAQPIFDKAFVKNKPDFITPLKNFYVANLDMTYPYDRGVNYAVKLGRQVSDLITHEN